MNRLAAAVPLLYKVFGDRFPATATRRCGRASPGPSTSCDHAASPPALGDLRAAWGPLLLPPPAAAQAPGPKQAVNLRILLPMANAELTIEDTLTQQTGTERLFVSPPLEPGPEYYLHR